MGTADLTDVAKARDAVEDAARTARRQLDTARHGLVDRAGSARDELTQRAGSARELLRDRLDEIDMEPRVRQAKIGFWSVVRAVIGALVAIPGAVTKALGTLSEVADEASERGTRLTAQSRELARSVPLTRAGRRRARMRTAAWALGGFAVGAAAGMAAGYVLGRRRPELAEEAWDAARETTDRASDAADEALERSRDAAGAGRSTAQEATADAAASVADRMSSERGEAAERGVGT